MSSCKHLVLTGFLSDKKKIAIGTRCAMCPTGASRWRPPWLFYFLFFLLLFSYLTCIGSDKKSKMGLSIEVALANLYINYLVSLSTPFTVSTVLILFTIEMIATTTSKIYKGAVIRSSSTWRILKSSTNKFLINK